MKRSPWWRRAVVDRYVLDAQGNPVAEPDLMRWRHGAVQHARAGRDRPRGDGRGCAGGSAAMNVIALVFALALGTEERCQEAPAMPHSSHARAREESPRTPKASRQTATSPTGDRRGLTTARMDTRHLRCAAEPLLLALGRADSYTFADLVPRTQLAL